MNRSVIHATLAVAVIATAAGVVVAGFLGSADGNPNITGNYTGKMIVKADFLNTERSKIRKKEPFVMTLRRGKGGDVFGDMVLGEGKDADFLSLSGQVGNKRLYLQTDESKCEITMIGKTKGSGDKLKLVVHGIVHDSETGEIGDVKFTAKIVKGSGPSDEEE